MNQDTARFIELATRPLANDTQLQMAARGELESLIAANAGHPEVLKKPAVIQINDEVRMRQSLTLIHEMVRKPRFTCYQTALLKQRIPMLPPRTDFLSQIPSILHVGNIRTSSISFQKNSRAF